ncbi:MAG: hypothetical protein ACP5M9_00525 [Candidatus Micrarchaeia archaeon]
MRLPLNSSFISVESKAESAMYFAPYLKPNLSRVNLKSFWSAGYGSSNAGPQIEEIVRNYIKTTGHFGANEIDITPLFKNDT